MSVWSFDKIQIGDRYINLFNFAKLITKSSENMMKNTVKKTLAFDFTAVKKKEKKRIRQIEIRIVIMMETVIMIVRLRDREPPPNKCMKIAFYSKQNKTKCAKTPRKKTSKNRKFKLAVRGKKPLFNSP